MTTTNDRVARARAARLGKTGGLASPREGRGEPLGETRPRSVSRASADGCSPALCPHLTTKARL